MLPKAVKSSLDYIVVFILLCISGNPLFIYSTKWTFAIAAFFFALMCAIAGKQIFSKRLLIWFSICICVFTLQFLFLDEVSIVADINFCFKLFIAFLACSFLGTRFRYVYFRTMYVICVASLFFSFLFILTKYPLGFKFDRYNTIVIFNVLTGAVAEEGYRNAAMFWEPGAFQGYILLVPLLYLNELKAFLKSNILPCIVLFLSLLLTKSTTAYIALFFLISAYSLINNKIRIEVKLTLAVAFAAILLFAVWRLDFIGAKIDEEVETAVLVGEDSANWSRSGAFFIDLANIRRHPIIGNGHLLDSRYYGLGDLMKGAGNGFSGAINMFGIPFVLLFYIFIFKNFKPFDIRQRIVMTIMVIMLLIGEYFMNYPLLWTLIFVELPIKTKRYVYSSGIDDCSQ